MDIDYLIVKEMVNISKLFDYICMMRIGCKPKNSDMRWHNARDFRSKRVSGQKKILCN
jgi:hypothetical protein